MSNTLGLSECRSSKSLGNSLWEVRSNLPGNRIARVLFCVTRREVVLLQRLHQKDP